MQLLQALARQEDPEKSHTSIVSHLRKSYPRYTRAEVDFVNDALLLLLAHNLDCEHLELDRQMERIRGLENELHEAVGIGGNEEVVPLAAQSPFIAESDRPRTQYSLQRLRAWTRLYCAQDHNDFLLPLTTSLEVLEEIAERLPGQLAALTGGTGAAAPAQSLLSILPDPQPLALETILELRQSLSAVGAFRNWSGSVATAVDRLTSETLTEKQRRDLNKEVQEAARMFDQYWPYPEGPAHFLRLEAICYSGVDPELAFILTTGLRPPPNGPYSTEGAHGITLLLAPSAPPPDESR